MEAHTAWAKYWSSKNACTHCRRPAQGAIPEKNRGVRIWNFQGYWRNSKWIFQGLIKNTGISRGYWSRKNHVEFLRVTQFFGVFKGKVKNLNFPQGFFRKVCPHLNPPFLLAFWNSPRQKIILNSVKTYYVTLWYYKLWYFDKIKSFWILLFMISFFNIGKKDWIRFLAQSTWIVPCWPCFCL